jgi:hypothetical protein
MNQGQQARQQARTAAYGPASLAGGSQRASAAISRSWGCWDRPGRSARSAVWRSERLARWPASRWARSARRMIAQARVVGLRAWLSLYSSTTTLAPKVAYCSSRRTHWYSSTGDRSRAGSAPGLSATNTGSRAGVAGWPLRWRAAAMARWRTASGLRAGMPRPCRWKALRSDGQVVASCWAAALTLPSCSASWKARSASPRSARKRLGCQPRGRRPRIGLLGRQQGGAASIGSYLRTGTYRKSRLGSALPCLVGWWAPFRCSDNGPRTSAMRCFPTLDEPSAGGRVPAQCLGTRPSSTGERGRRWTSSV